MEPRPSKSFCHFSHRICASVAITRGASVLLDSWSDVELVLQINSIVEVQQKCALYLRAVCVLFTAFRAE